jgi:hypothetical protein
VICEGAHITTLSLEGFQLEGQIPASIGQMSALKQIIFDRNLISGTVPASIAQLPLLNTLVLSGNKMTGEVPNLPFAQYTGGCSIAGWDNNFSCPLPPNARTCGSDWPSCSACTGDSVGMIESECVAWTAIFDAMNGPHWRACSDKRTDPCGCNSVVCSMRQIYALHLGSNQLASTIPTELGSLQQLQVLELHSNLLTGTIPVALNKLRLRGLQLQNNELTGLIPALPFLEYGHCERKFCCSLQNASNPTNRFTCPLPPNSSQCEGGAPTCPTPPPTPVMYSCNATVGQCVLDPEGSLSPGECIATCTCVTPHNCGQLNGTSWCNTQVTKCNVCDRCCQAYFKVQASCDGCFATPAPDGCGGLAANGTNGAHLTLQ